MFLDDDECGNLGHGCSHHCTNTPGSFVCSCEHGYELEEDGKTCNLTGMSCMQVHTHVLSTCPHQKHVPPEQVISCYICQFLSF